MGFCGWIKYKGTVIIISLKKKIKETLYSVKGRSMFPKGCAAAH